MGNCPRCGGRLYEDRDKDSACINCGCVVYRYPPLPEQMVLPLRGGKGMSRLDWKRGRKVGT